MKTLLLAIAVAAVVLGSAVALRNHIRSGAEEKRRAAYQLALQAYSQALKPGLTRKQVETYLRTKGVSFTHMCCIDQDRSAFADLVKAGEEDRPWYCSEHVVYLAFEFTASAPRNHWEIRDTDVLKNVRVFHQLGGCL